MSAQNPPLQPISMLSLFTEMIDEMLESSVDQLANLQQVKDRPHILDDETVDLITRLYSEQLEDHGIVMRQLKHWRHIKLEDSQIQEVTRLITQTESLKSHNEKILLLADQIKQGTIDKIMDMDDLDLGMAVLSGKMKVP